MMLQVAGGALSRRSVNTCALLTRAGQSLRISRGQGRSGNEDGPLHDTPDFHFADGRPGPITPKMEKWMWKRENDKKKLDEVRSSALAHNAELDTMRRDAYTASRKKWSLQHEVKALIGQEIERIQAAHAVEAKEDQIIADADEANVVGPDYHGKKLTKTQSEFLAKRVAFQQKKQGQTTAKTEAQGEKKQDADAPAKKKRIKGVKKAE